MPQTGLKVGLIGLGAMGRNLALNMSHHGISVIGYDPSPVEGCLPKGTLVGSSASVPLLLTNPRIIFLMVPAGEAVDQQIQALFPHLQSGDILVDCGNSHFKDTRRRSPPLTQQGIHYVGLGVSGGAEGARGGPSMMADFCPEALSEVLTLIVARDKEATCLATFGGSGAGHFVKMIHNGIEYAEMQMIAETVHLLRYNAFLTVMQISDLLEKWNEGVLGSYLLEITAKILRVKENGMPFIDLIVDEAEQKGTGYWALEAAMALGVSVPSLAAAVDARALSSMSQLRSHLRRSAITPVPLSIDLQDVHDALLASKVCAYAQGFSVLAAAKSTIWPNLEVSEAARVWQQGSIIRSTLLKTVQQAFLRTPGLQSLLLEHIISTLLAKTMPGLRKVVVAAQFSGLPVPALASALGYFDAVTAPRLWADLVQAQRDYFGQHGFKRIDKEGVQHGPWGENP